LPEIISRKEFFRLRGEINDEKFCYSKVKGEELPPSPLNLRLR